MDVTQMATVMAMQRTAAKLVMEMDHEGLAKVIVTKDDAVLSGVYSAMVAMIDASALARMNVLIALFELLAMKDPEVYDAVSSFFIEYAMMLERGVCNVNGEYVRGKYNGEQG